MAGDDEKPIIVKKIKKGGHGHHGGAWKVAYADFVTAMMAFFLLMWLINTTSPEQKQGIADYFAPASVSSSKSGAGGVLGGTSFSSDGARNAGTKAVLQDMVPKSSDSDAKGSPTNQNDDEDLSEETIKRAQTMREDYQFDQAAMSLRQALQDMPELTELSKHLLVEKTPEGMHIQLVDQEGRAMFAPQSAEPYDRTRILLREVAGIVRRLPNRLVISGHTDGTPYFGADGATNWEISAERANAARAILQKQGVDGDRIERVAGKAGNEPLFPDDPYLPANRRISILLLREAPVLPPGHRP